MRSFKEFVVEAKAKPKAKLIDKGYKMILGHLEAYRHMKSRGANFSGWVVSNRYNNKDHSDPISTREEARRVLRQW